MKHRFIALFIVALACTAGGGALASTASAANCNFAESTTWYDGSWRWQGEALGCTDVDAVNFQVSNVNCACADITDVTRGNTIHFAIGGGGIAGATDGHPRVNFFTPVPWAVPVWGQGCGAPPFTVHNVWHVKIHNIHGGWSGSWYRIQGGNYLIC